MYLFSIFGNLVYFSEGMTFTGVMYLGFKLVANYFVRKLLNFSLVRCTEMGWKKEHVVEM